jgi:hypothetical protein
MRNDASLVAIPVTVIAPEREAAKAFDLGAAFALTAPIQPASLDAALGACSARRNNGSGR